MMGDAPKTAFRGRSNPANLPKMIVRRAAQFFENWLNANSTRQML
jgi:hypothetical protein